MCGFVFFFFFSSRRRHTRLQGDWSSDVCSSDLSYSVRMRVGSTIAPASSRRSTSRSTAFGRGAAIRSPRGPARQGRRSQIGRASCRGRGEISVVAVSLKKKKKKENGETNAKKKR